MDGATAIPPPPSYLSVAERNFESFSVEANPGVQYLRHPSGVVVLCLASTGDAVVKGPVERIEWSFAQRKGGKKDRSKVEVVGRGKKGSLPLFPESRICTLQCVDGSQHTIRSGLRANLFEVNADRLNTNPDLARTAPTSHGYLAILLP